MVTANTLQSRVFQSIRLWEEAMNDARLKFWSQIRRAISCGEFCLVLLVSAWFIELFPHNSFIDKLNSSLQNHVFHTITTVWFFVNYIACHKQSYFFRKIRNCSRKRSKSEEWLQKYADWQKCAAQVLSMIIVNELIYLLLTVQLQEVTCCDNCRKSRDCRSK